LIGTITGFQDPGAVGYDSASGNIYVSNHGSNYVSILSGATNKVLGNVTVGQGPVSSVFDPNNGYVYVTNYNTNEAPGNTVSVISTTTLVQPPTHTTITSAVDGNGNPVQNGDSIVSTSIIFQVTATPGTNPIAGFQCSLDGSAFSSCATTNPATISYNNLAVGQHIFKVRAVDTQGNTDPSPDTFSWTVFTPTQAVQNLINTINSFNLPKGVTTSLEAPLNAAITQLGHNNNAAACNQLSAFLNQVNAKQANGQLTSQQAADLIQQATSIQHAIGCSNIGGYGRTNFSIIITITHALEQSKSGSWLTHNVAKRQHDAIHHALSATCLNEQECYDALWSYLTWQYEIDFVCNPEKRDQIIADVEERKAKLLENAGLCRIED
jgi:YVTN family beta-propeller protein